MLHGRRPLHKRCTGFLRPRVDPAKLTMKTLLPESELLAPATCERPSLLRRFRRLLLGAPVSSEHLEHTLLPKLLALPVFASDAISSVAYATQQIVLALGAAGLYLYAKRSLYTYDTLLIAGLIVGLLVIVVFSYWQTIFAY